MRAKAILGSVVLVGALFSGTAGAQSTTYWDLPKPFGAASSGPVPPSAAPAIFETSWLHLRETHGAGVPSVKSADTCDLQSVAVFESSWLHLRETHGVGVDPGKTALAMRSDGLRC